MGNSSIIITVTILLFIFVLFGLFAVTVSPFHEILITFIMGVLVGIGVKNTFDGLLIIFKKS